MTDATSSCRPKQVLSLGTMLISIAEGLPPRIAALRSAVDTYNTSCDPSYTVPLEGTPVALGGWGIDEHVLGDWTQAVAHRFLQADAVDAYTGAQGAIVTLPDSVVVASLPSRFAKRPYLGEAATGSVDWSHTDVVQQWLDELGSDTSAASDAQDGTSTASAMFQRFLTGEGVYEPQHAAASSVTAGVKAFSDLNAWVGPALTFAAGFLDQYDRDEGLSEGTRIAAATAQGAGDAGSFTFGFWAGTAVASETGPFAPLVGLAVGLGAELLTQAGLDHVLPAPSTTERIASPELTSEEAARIQLDADDQAATDVQHDPAVEARVQQDTSAQLQHLRYIAGEAGPPPVLPTTPNE